jgi:hypothetical protein
MPDPLRYEPPRESLSNPFLPVPLSSLFHCLLKWGERVESRD